MPTSQNLDDIRRELLRKLKSLPSLKSCPKDFRDFCQRFGSDIHNMRALHEAMERWVRDQKDPASILEELNRA